METLQGGARLQSCSAVTLFSRAMDDSNVDMILDFSNTYLKIKLTCIVSLMLDGKKPNSLASSGHFILDSAFQELTWALNTLDFCVTTSCALTVCLFLLRSFYEYSKLKP
jgi:hypothetical protein